MLHKRFDNFLEPREYPNHKKSWKFWKFFLLETLLTVYNIPDTIGSVKIMWDEPDDMGTIKNFEISVECEKCIQKKQTYISKSFEYTVPNLEPGVFYKVKVVGVSLRTDRYGPPSISQRFQIPDRRPLPSASDIRAKSTLRLVSF